MTQHRRPDGIDLTARSRARRRATQALYAWQVGGNLMKDVIEAYVRPLRSDPNFSEHIC